jgi:hypothetical protein
MLLQHTMRMSQQILSTLHLIGQDEEVSFGAGGNSFE